jgi:hypothetical protein
MTSMKGWNFTALDEDGFAYVNVRRWLLGARMVSLVRDAQGVWTAELARVVTTAGTTRTLRSWIVWSGNRTTVTWNVATAWGVAFMEQLISGASAAFAGTSVLVGDVPLLLRQ